VNVDNSTSNVLIPLDSWTSGLLVYKEPLSGKWLNTRKQEKERRTCRDYLKFEESRVRIKCGSISKKKKSNYSCFQDLRSSCNEDMWAVAPTLGAAIVAVDLGDNFTVKGHHLFMIKDRQFDGRSRADPHKHIAEFVEVCGMFRYGNTNMDAIKLKLFPSSLAGEANIWFNELSPEIKGEMKEMRDGCNKYGGPHPSSYCDDKSMGGPKEEEANYASGGYQGNYYG
nr:reverse transcriptase domain-containing protein [Tanacetum cinerariifolium]